MKISLAQSLVWVYMTLKTTYGTTEDTHRKTIEYLRAKKQEDPNFTVLDVGGGHYKWASEVVD